MTHGSLFSGIGGFDLASEWMGWTNAFHCEWEEFPRKILQYHFPESKSYGDINETDFTIWKGKIDILTGGFPCQPYSAAGKRLGKDDERHLWPQMLRAIREIEPRWVIGENVHGLVSWNGGMVFEEVQVDLENEGYEVQPYILPAASVNAPHRRDRVWFVAYSKSKRARKNKRGIRGLSDGFGEWKKRNAPDSECNRSQEQADKQELEKTGVGKLYAWQSRDKGNAPDSNNAGLQEEGAEQQSARFEQYRELDNTTTDSNGRRWDEGSQRQHNGVGERQICENQSNDRNKVWCDIGECRGDRVTADTDKIRLQFSEDTREVRGGQSEVCQKGHQFTDAIEANGEESNATDSDSERLFRSGQDFGGTQSERGKTSKWSINRIQSKDGQEDNRSYKRWQDFPTQPPICGGDDGIPRELDSITFPKWRNESIKAYGNAIVPQVALQLFKTIEQYDNQT